MTKRSSLQLVLGIFLLLAFGCAHKKKSSHKSKTSQTSSVLTGRVALGAVVTEPESGAPPIEKVSEDDFRKDLSASLHEAGWSGGAASPFILRASVANILQPKQADANLPVKVRVYYSLMDKRNQRIIHTEEIVTHHLPGDGTPADQRVRVATRDALQDNFEAMVQKFSDWKPVIR